jgi:hypothetical protein
MKRLAVAAALGGFALLGLLPGAAAAKLLGPKLPLSYDDSTGCPGNRSCQTVLTRYVKAPFGGKITRFRVQGLKGTVRLQVIDGNTQYKAARESSARKANLGHHQVKAFKANLQVAKWDRIGLRFSRHTTLGVHQNSAGETFETVFFRPPLVVGGPWRYQPSATSPLRLMFNATIRR